MGGKETGWFRLEGGTVQEMDLPLHETIAHRVAKGEITRVANAEGDPYEEPEGLPEVSDVEAAANMAAVHEELSNALDRNTELAAELEAVTTQRDEALAEVERLNANGAQMAADLDAVTAERDALRADATTKAPAKATKAKADQ